MRLINYQNILYVEDDIAYFADGSTLRLTWYEYQHAEEAFGGASVIPVQGFKVHVYYFDNQYGEQRYTVPVIAFRVSGEYVSPITGTDGFDVSWDHWVVEGPGNQFFADEQIFKSQDDWLEKARSSTHSYMLFYDDDGLPKELGKLVGYEQSSGVMYVRVFDLDGNPTVDREIRIDDDQVAFFPTREACLKERGQ
ncbi:MAG: hypothetical protein WD795_05190 [Woeseia sp.]